MRSVWFSVALVGWGATGCVAPPADVRERLGALEIEGKAMDAALDMVEARLIGNQASVRLWQELERRHRYVSAVHCQHADKHLEAISAHYMKMEEKARTLKRRRVASVDTVLTSGRVGKSRRN